MALILRHPTKKNIAFYREANTLQPIFYYDEGTDLGILKATYAQLDNMLSYYSKVTVVFLQLHTAVFSQDNKLLSKFIYALKKHLTKQYKCRIAHAWVREQNTAHAQHYHLAIMLNGHVCNNSHLIDELTNKIWASANKTNYAYRVKNRVYKIEKYKTNNELSAARMRLSYFAKKTTKVKSPHCKSFGVSQLTRKRPVKMSG